jgi:hypothetical protein
MSSKIEVPRDLLEALLNADSVEQHEGIDRELRAMLAAPVVERQPVEIELGSPPVEHMAWLLDKVVNPGAYPQKVLHEQIRSTLDVIGKHTAPPELAELQATIAQLTAENERLQMMLDEETDRVKIAIDIQQKAIGGRDKYAAEIERLKGGQGEPVAWAANSNLAEIADGALWSGTLWGKKNPPMLEERTPLYTSRPILVLPERKATIAFGEPDIRGEAWNACLDKVKELNQ